MYERICGVRRKVDLADWLQPRSLAWRVLNINFAARNRV